LVFIHKLGFLFKIKPPAPLPARRAYSPEGRACALEGHAKKNNHPDGKSTGPGRHIVDIPMIYPP